MKGQKSAGVASLYGGKGLIVVFIHKSRDTLIQRYAVTAKSHVFSLVMNFNCIYDLDRSDLIAF